MADSTTVTNNELSAQYGNIEIVPTPQDVSEFFRRRPDQLTELKYITLKRMHSELLGQVQAASKDVEGEQHG